MTDKSTAVATTKEDLDQLPAFMRDSQVASGSDNFDSSDVVLPKIKLLQATSAEVEAYDNAKTGIFWHTGLDMPLGTEIHFVIADRRKKYLLSAPMEDGQGVLARADDAKTWDRTGKFEVKLKGIKKPVVWEIKDKDVLKSGLADWGTQNPEDEDSPPAATLFYDYLVFLPDHPDLGPAVLSLARSQIKPAKKGLNDKIKLHLSNKRPMQGCIFIAEVTSEKNSDGQDFKNMRFKSGGFVQDEALFNTAVEHAGSLADYKIQDEGDTGEESSGPADDGEGNF